MNIKLPFENGWFLSGFVIAVVGFLSANVIQHQIAYAEYTRPSESGIQIADGGGYLSGFPFTMYFFGGGNPFYSEILWSGVIANFVTAIVIASVIGWITLFLSKWVKARNSGMNRT
jgi:hypothetical protein